MLNMKLERANVKESTLRTAVFFCTISDPIPYV